MKDDSLPHGFLLDLLDGIARAKASLCQCWCWRGTRKQRRILETL